MIENPKVRVGMIAQKRAEIHFMSQGYSVCWPAVDNGFDLLIHKDDEHFEAIRIQVKSLNPSGLVNLVGTMNRSRETRRVSRHSAAAAPRHYDVLAIVCDEYVWAIPEAETRGTTAVRVKQDGRYYTKSKWNQYREERLDGRSTQA